MKISGIIQNPTLVSAIQDLARSIKPEADLSSLTGAASLNTEMEAH